MWWFCSASVVVMVVTLEKIMLMVADSDVTKKTKQTTTAQASGTTW